MECGRFIAFAFRIRFSHSLFAFALRDSTRAMLGPFPYLHGTNKTVLALGTRALLIGISAVAIGGTDDIIEVKTIGLL
jgi:hypothetical protein